MSISPHYINDLMQLYINKSELLEKLVTNFQIIIKEIENVNENENQNQNENESTIAEDINAKVLINQQYYEMIDVIDSNIKTIILNLDEDQLRKMNIVSMSLRQRHKAALKLISELHSESVKQIEATVSETKNQLAKIKQKKSLYKNYTLSV
jgi:hypothetical protein